MDPRAGASPVISYIRRFCADQSGSTSIEYSLIAALIGLAIISAASSIGSNIGKPLDIASGNLNK